jgi:nucleotide-binding universal stress UspA family protein
MKLLIAEDPAHGEATGVADLKRGGFPDRCEVVVLSVADVLMPAAEDTSPGGRAPLPPHVQHAMNEAQRAVGAAQQRLQGAFPHWLITTATLADSPAWGIIRKAEEWRPDLIVVGPQRYSALSRFVLGSVSLKVLSEALCAVRVARNTAVDTGRPPRLLVGSDGSPGADAAVTAVLARQWPNGTAAHVVAAVNNGEPTADAEAAQRVNAVATRLQERGLTVSTSVIQGDAKDAIVDEATRCEADCIFLGARGMSTIERLLLGSVSAAVAARASCSVEVVRARV